MTIKIIMTTCKLWFLTIFRSDILLKLSQNLIYILFTSINRLFFAPWPSFYTLKENKIFNNKYIHFKCDTRFSYWNIWEIYIYIRSFRWIYDESRWYDSNLNYNNKFEALFWDKIGLSQIVTHGIIAILLRIVIYDCGLWFDWSWRQHSGYQHCILLIEFVMGKMIQYYS